MRRTFERRDVSKWLLTGLLVARCKPGQVGEGVPDGGRATDAGGGEDAGTGRDAGVADAGATADGGAPVPSWVPQPGKVGSIALNTPGDVDPCPAQTCSYNRPPFRSQRAIFDAWCGGAYAPSFGALGSLLHMGGGHGDYGGNEVYRFDFSSRLWSRATEPHPYDFDDSGPSGTFPWDPAWGDFLDDGSPVSSHNYGCLFAMTGAQAHNANGKLVYPLMGAVGRGAVNIPRAHALDLDTLRWERLGATSGPSTQNGTGGQCAHDPGRAVAWAFPGGAFSVGKLDLGSTEWTVYPSDVYFRWGVMSCFDPVSGLVPLLQPTGNEEQDPTVLWLFDPSRPSSTKVATISGDPPNGAGCGFAYCPLTDRFYLHGGVGVPTDELIVLTPPRSGDPLLGTWAFSRESFTGDAPNGASRVYTKFHWVDGLRAFASYGSTDNAVHLFRPRGT